MLLRPFLTKMSKEGLDCVDIDMEQSDGGNAVELNEAAAPSPNPSIMSDTSGCSSAAKVPPAPRQNSKSKISERVKEHFTDLPTGQRKC